MPRRSSKQSAAVTRRRNAVAINQLAAQVAALKRRDWGPEQCSHQLMVSSVGDYSKVSDNDMTVHLPESFNWTTNKMVRDIEVQRNMPLLFDVSKQLRLRQLEGRHPRCHHRARRLLDPQGRQRV